MNSSRPGGRSARVKAAVHQALLDELVEKPYGRIGIESVAARAGVHKTSVYRRWATLETLFAEVAEELAVREVPVPDTGSLVGDLRTVMRSSVRLFKDPYGAAISRVLVAESDHSPALAEMSQRHWERGVANLRPVFARARARGELGPEPTDERLVEALWAPLYLRRLVNRKPLTYAYVDTVIADVLG
ncbi:TetR/AcrR family transcriptional regulator C-terminal ligand-binding domain-containing protein [Kribbella sp. NPDC005582]|uniref:TetR/AcrR family transcriptional regulator n=1 Tax=Kribbella sp. NPDC005582 TaxID=3156893 RepID=UPI0033B0D3FF